MSPWGDDWQLAHQAMYGRHRRACPGGAMTCRSRADNQHSTGTSPVVVSIRSITSLALNHRSTGASPVVAEIREAFDVDDAGSINQRAACLGGLLPDRYKRRSPRGQPVHRRLKAIREARLKPAYKRSPIPLRIHRLEAGGRHGPAEAGQRRTVTAASHQSSASKTSNWRSSGNDVHTNRNCRTSPDDSRAICCEAG